MAARVASAGDALSVAIFPADSIVGQRSDSTQCPPEMVERCSLLAARGDVQELRPLYARLQPTLPADVALYCRFAFARAEGDNAAASAIVDTLESQYANRLDLRGLLALCDIKCEALRRMGQYADLQNYCKSRLEWCSRRGIKASRRENLKFYQQLAQRFQGAPATETLWTSTNAIVPVSREWPVMVPVSVAGDSVAEGSVLPFLYDERQSYTIISEDDARECGVTPIGEPLKLNTANGKTTVRPAMAARLQLGNLVLHNHLVFVATDDLPAPYNRSVGNDVLLRFRQCVMGDDYMSVRNEGEFRRIDRSQRSDSAHTPRCVADYFAEHDILGLLRNETSLQFTASEAELRMMDEAIVHYFVDCTEASLPVWLETVTAEEPPIGRQAYTLYNTIDGFVYEHPEDGCYKTVILNSENTKGCLVNLQNMMIYVP